MVRFISAPILYCMVSTVLVPISAEAQDFKRSFWLHSALAQATETRQAPFTVSLAPGLNSVIGNAAMAGIGLSVVGALALGQTDQVSGAGGSLSQNALPTGDYRDTTQGAYGTEYRYNANLAQLNVLPLNNYGYDGTGINVAVVDSGIDASHPEFLNSTIRGYDFSNSATGYGGDPNGHGTHVASIIAGDADGTGMRGVAYDATLYSYRVDADGDGTFEALNTDSQLAAVARRHITDNIHVSNNSWGSATAVTAYTTSQMRSIYSRSISAFADAQAAGTLFVFAAGNSGNSEVSIDGGLPYHAPELVDAWLVVVASDENGVETGFTNRCGVAAAFCVTAPGNRVLAADAGTTGYVALSGTSMAAPFVSGLAAALMEKFPNLTPKQIATRIKTTASLAPLTGFFGETLANDGTAAMEAIFGHGLVDSGAAAAQIGNLTYALGPDVSRGQDLSQSKLALPAGVGRDLAKQIMADDFVVFDSFDNAMFTVSGSQVFEAAAAGFVPSYGAGSAIIDATGGSVKARRALQSQPKEQLIFSFLQQGDTPITADYWQGMAALFAPQPFVVPAAKLRMSWESRQGSISSLMPFLSFGSGALGQGSDRSLEIGLASKVRLGGAIDLISSISVGEQAINFGLDDQSDLIGLVKAEFGVNATLNAANRFFLRYEQSRYSDRAATESDFGMSAARADSWMMGVETQLPEADLTVGVRNDYALSQGTVSLMTPASMLKDGTILYDHKSYGLDRSVRLRPFVAVQHDTYGGTLNFGARFGSWDRSDLEGVELSFSRQF
ncbi:S8 family peptidase [Planktomarina temperata]|uniref:S8 family peptidase n=1 Tax=Planktomarina temperata TaxID=1284658 RepID=UPI003261B1DB